MTSRRPDLSVVIPALNEAAHLPYLLQDLVWQKNIHFEVIVVDGGSTDATREKCHEFSANCSYDITIIDSEPGRATQLNRGAALCNADDLLFLHADSRIRNSSLLADAHRFLSHHRQKKNNPQLCGHFALKFLSSPGKLDDYYFYESKTHLNKPDCINGDQGFWINRDYFYQLGQFDDSLLYMEDARLAQKITDDHNWITLPGNIETSARRFEIEGFTKRQILNSFLCNFNAIGEKDYFKMAGDIYQQQDRTARLKLRPFLTATHRYMYKNGIRSALWRWYLTGSYIARNAWQLAFALDCLRNKKQGLTPNGNEASTLEFYDKHIARVTEWPVIRLLTGIITVIWFYSLFLLR